MRQDQAIGQRQWMSRAGLLCASGGRAEVKPGQWREVLVTWHEVVLI